MGQEPACVACGIAQPVGVMAEGGWFYVGMPWSNSKCTGLFICIPISDTNKNLESNFYASFFLTVDFLR